MAFIYAFTYTIAVFFLLLLPAFCPAADMNLTLSHSMEGETAFVTVRNLSPAAVTVESVGLQLIRLPGPGRPAADSGLNASRSSEPQRPPSSEEAPVFEPASAASPVGRQLIHSGKEETYAFNLGRPSAPGSYPVLATVRYLNDGNVLSLKHAWLYHNGEAAPLNESCRAGDANIGGVEGEVALYSTRPGIWRLILPDELRAVSSSTLYDKKTFRVKNTLDAISASYPYFAFALELKDGKSHAALFAGTLSVGKGASPKAHGRGRMPSAALLGLTLAFLAVSFVFLSGKEGGPFGAALAKYSSRMFLLTGAYYLLKNAPSWLDASRAFVSWKPYAYFARIAAENLRGGNYEHFFTYFIDAYWAACLLLALPYLYYWDSGKAVEDDKYASLVSALIGPLRGRFALGQKARLGLLTVFVKLFFVPILVSWVINNTFHQRNLTADFSLELYALNVYLVALFIYIDTAVFCFGYLFEFGRLRNEIKSVEPTLLGWLVCLWCYPPFNAFSFGIFDHRLFDIARQYPLWVHALMTCLITLLWGVFAWASVALGFKASNLTNRGIVGMGGGIFSAGPYRFVRHPAYTAKLLIWYIQGIFFGQFFVGLLLGFTLIYLLRAWTEERHLSRDPDYAAYKKAVRKRFIPGVI